MKTGNVSLELQLQRGKMAPIKVELEDPLEDQHGPLHKRSKLSSSLSPQQQHDLGSNAFPVPPSQYNPLDEPSPLGLRLRKSPSLLDLIQMRLSQGNNSKAGANSKKEQKGAAASNSNDKLKASNFPASILTIGTWEYKSRYEGDLVAKCYFAKHKIVWEVLDGSLKNKIEIQWSDIMALKATYPDDEPGTLDVVLARQPLFFRETNPQPRKHTLWQATSDFTGGQASINRRHYLQCPQGLLGKHFEKLIQCDPRLNYLSQQAEISLESPYFEPRISVFNESDEANNEYDMNSDGGPAIFDLRDVASPSGPQSSSSKNEQQDFVGRHPNHFRETPSLSSGSLWPAQALLLYSMRIQAVREFNLDRKVTEAELFIMDSSVAEEIKSSGTGELKNLSCWDHVRVPGLLPSMWMSDLVSHIEHWISEHRTSTNPIPSNEERESLEILEEISKCLFTDSRHAPTSDEKSIMSRVDSLCCFLQKDPATVQDLPPKGGNGADMTMAMADNKTIRELNCSESEVRSKVAEGSLTPDGESTDASGCKQGAGMSRKDSVGELLLNLPRIESLPQFCFNL